MKTAKKKTGNDIAKVKPVDWVKVLKHPVLFMVGKEDNLAKPMRVKEVFDSYGGDDKQFYLIEGTHQTARDEVTVRKAVSFALRIIAIEQSKLESLRSIGKASPGASMTSNHSITKKENQG